MIKYEVKRLVVIVIVFAVVVIGAMWLMEKVVVVTPVKKWSEQYCQDEKFKNWLQEDCRGVVR